MSVRAGLTNHAVLTLTSAIEERLEAERARVDEGWGGAGDGKTRPSAPPPLRLQPTLHNLTGTLCVALEFLGTKKKPKTKQLQYKKQQKKN